MRKRDTTRTGKPILLTALAITMAGVAGLILTNSATAQDSNRDPKIVAAGQAALDAKKRHERVTRLRDAGSASDWDVHRAEYQRKIALLKFGILDQPAKEDEYKMTMARTNVKFATLRVKTLERLYSKRSASKIDLRRAETDLDIAKLQLQSLESRGQEKFYAFKIATARHELARSEYESALRLFRKGSLSKPQFEAARSRWREQDAEMKSKKKALGAKATVIRKT